MKARAMLFVIAAMSTCGGLSVCAGLASAESRPVPLSEMLGDEIDSTERSQYGLFPSVNGFEEARILQAGEGRYRLEYRYHDGSGDHTRSRRLSPESFEQTRTHVALVETARDLSAASDSGTEPWLLQRVALRFAGEARYDLANGIAVYLTRDYPASDAGKWAAEYGPRLEKMATRSHALSVPGSLIDQRGRSDLIVFSGLYGLWLGVAVPVAFDAQSAQAYAAGLIMAPPVAIMIASEATKKADITQGEATLISLGGKLGTWQGLGWSSMSEADGNAVIRAGVLSGLAGILVAIPVSKALGFNEGRAAITNSSMIWGGWFGAVAGIMANHDENEHGILPDMLIGSDVLVLASGIASRGAQLSNKRMRLINLSGVVGTVFGLGVDLLFEIDDSTTSIAIAGAGSVAGLAIGTAATRDHDKDRDLAQGLSVEFPKMAMRSVPGAGRIPTLGVRVTF